MNHFERDYALIETCPHCGARQFVRCDTTCPKPHGSDPGGAYIIRCDVDDDYDTRRAV